MTTVMKINLGIVLGLFGLLAMNRTAMACPQDDRVCVYGDANYRGQSTCWNAGESVPHLRSVGWNDRISSIRVFGRARAIVYKDSNYRGELLEVSSDIPDLKDLPGGWNDKISSIRVIYGLRGEVPAFGDRSARIRGHGHFRLEDGRDRELNEAVVDLRSNGDAFLEFRGEETLRFRGRWERDQSDIIDLDIRGDFDSRSISGDGRIYYRRGEVESIDIRGRERRSGDQFRLSFDADWPDSDRPDDDRSGPGRLTWSGRVDEEVEILIRRDRVRVQTISGAPAYNERFSFSNPLPRRDVTVQVRRIRGRGSVEVIQQPDRHNNYTAIVRIRDNKGGADHYEFELTW
ncbi:MAG: beta/gamma crystallin family protein [Acidobacteria bacterium]|nr:beta/gamma crystallin family protein [Acidobacteriota bacterium]